MRSVNRPSNKPILAERSDMSRTLPLRPDPVASSAGEHTEADAPIVPASSDAVLEGTVQLYDPAMCCPTGLCGPGVDPALLQVARDVRWLQARGVRVERFGLTQEPQAFVANPGIAGLLQAFGDQALPAAVVNGRVVTHGRYPTRDELSAALTSAAVAADDARPAPEGECS